MQILSQNLQVNIENRRGFKAQDKKRISIHKFAILSRNLYQVIKWFMMRITWQNVEEIFEMSPTIRETWLEKKDSQSLYKLLLSVINTSNWQLKIFFRLWRWGFLQFLRKWTHQQ